MGCKTCLGSGQMKDNMCRGSRSLIFISQWKKDILTGEVLKEI